jgi:hypothetical protein
MMGQRSGACLRMRMSACSPRGIHELDSGHVDLQPPRVPADDFRQALEKGAAGGDVDLAPDRHGRHAVVPPVADRQSRSLISSHRLLPSPGTTACRSEGKTSSRPAVLQRPARDARHGTGRAVVSHHRADGRFQRVRRARNAAAASAVTTAAHRTLKASRSRKLSESVCVQNAVSEWPSAARRRFRDGYHGA